MTLTLPYGLTFENLYHRDGLIRLDREFLQFLHLQVPDLHHAYTQTRQPHAHQKNTQENNSENEVDESALMIALAPWVEQFVGAVFDENAARELQAKHNRLKCLIDINRQFVQRVAIKKYPLAITQTFAVEAIRRDLQIYTNPNDEYRFAESIAGWLEKGETHLHELDLAARYAAWAALTEAGEKQHQGQTLFKVPAKLDFDHLIPVERMGTHGAWQLPEGHRRARDGFSLTDSGLSREDALHQAHYCIWCHHQGKDSCSKGMKPKIPKQGNGRFAKNGLGATLTGCPLEQKISEMNEVKSQGLSLAALSIIMIDNPMVPATGHRICNDCMKACIFQKQDPVNIPGTESQILRDVLSLPWGVEIYSLLTRWNPLNFRRPLPLPDSGYKVLIAGTGPAGFTLAHHLLNDGHMVVAIDGLKIEPLPPEISGSEVDGRRVAFRPIREFKEIAENLNERPSGGFGGVAEYGITVRWDKNFLTLIRLTLERRAAYSLYGGVRFGGALTIDKSFELGFDHIALCMGAGSPTLIPLENSLASGVRQASDFLMALQLTGAARETSLANLQLRLPVVVVGGGLTAMDTATEAMAYYPVQIERFARRHEELCRRYGTETVEARWTDYDCEVALEFLTHAQALKIERQQAQAENRRPDFQNLIRSWGGVTVAYRRTLAQSPAYRLNHEEVEKALEEGIVILDEAIPQKVEIDILGNATALQVQKAGETLVLPARSILIAAGTKPNTSLRYDEPDSLLMDGQTFQAHDETGNPVQPERLTKPETPYVLTHLRPDGKGVSFFGDMHPSFAGNVVKAMASAKQGYPVITRTLTKTAPSAKSGHALKAELDHALRATVHAVHRLTPSIVEVIIHAPLAAQAFQPGQFYRLQNYETLSPVLNNTSMTMEGLALTGAWVDLQKGLLGTVVLEMGASSNLCADMKPGQQIVLMGPTGTPTEIPEGETVLLAGGGLGNAVLFSIGLAMRARKCRVIYFAGYKKMVDRYKVAAIEAAADVVIWCCDEAPGFVPTRPQDFTFVGNMVEAMTAYGQGKLGKGNVANGNIANSNIALEDVNRLLVIGSDGMMAAVTAARYSVLAPYLNKAHIAIGSINSPMQCMMKEICAQCLQRHVDPITGKESFVYTCMVQDQPLDHVDFTCLSRRLGQNSLSEKLTDLWATHCRSVAV